MVGSTVSHYRIIEKIGEGGMGVVYKAEDLKLKRNVALKVLPSLNSQSPEDHNRFIQEARLTSSLNHPNILTVHEFEEIDGVAFMVTEIVEGQTLLAMIQSEPLSVDSILDIALQAVNGIGEAHARGIIHRDLKAENVMVSFKGQVKVMDFGLARLVGTSRVTTPGSLVGTFAYMSPEQINEHNIDARSDIFAFGILLYHMVAGVLPFQGNTISELLSSILRKQPDPLRNYRGDIPEALEAIIFHALEKAPENRYQSMDELKADLDRVRAKQSLADFPHLRKRTVWERWVITAMLLLLVAVGLYLMKPFRTPSSSNQEKSIAVLPFQNTSSDAEIDFLRIGLADDIITRLAFIRSLRVKPTSAVVMYQGKDFNAKMVGDTLGADCVLEGRYNRSGDKFIVNTQLVNVKTGDVMWGDAFELRWQEMRTLQNNVAYRIVDALELQLTETEHSEVGKVRTNSADAYEHYLRGISITGKGSRENNEMAMKMFERAIDLDPKFAEAHAALSGVYVEEFWSNYSPDTAWITKGELTAREALALDERLASAHASLSFALRIKGRYKEALLEAVNALKIDPRYSFSLEDLSEFYRHRGEYGKAIAIAERAAANDPSFNINRVRARIYQFKGDYTASVTELRRAIERSPSDSWLRGGLLALSYIHLGDPASAEEEIKRAESVDPDKPETRISRAMLETLRGNFTRAQGDLDAVRDYTERDYALARHVASIYAKQNKPDLAIEWIERATKLGNRWYSWYITDDWFASLRQNPRFQDAMEKMKAELDAIAIELEHSGLE